MICYFSFGSIPPPWLLKERMFSSLSITLYYIKIIWKHFANSWKAQPYLWFSWPFNKNLISILYSQTGILWAVIVCFHGFCATIKEKALYQMSIYLIMYENYFLFYRKYLEPKDVWKDRKRVIWNNVAILFLTNKCDTSQNLSISNVIWT